MIVRVLVLAAAMLAIAAPVLGDSYGGPWPKYIAGGTR